MLARKTVPGQNPGWKRRVGNTLPETPPALRTPADRAPLPARGGEPPIGPGFTESAGPLLLTPLPRPPEAPDFVRMKAPTTERLDAIERSVLICGDALNALEVLPDESVQTVVTSPPYWSLRDYQVEHQVGCAESLSDYVDSIVAVFKKLQRVLRSDGTVWLNVGDAYTSGNRRYRAPDRKNRVRKMNVRPPTPDGLKPKDLIGVPWRIAIALQSAGWWLRSEIIWAKPNAHPESVRDRPTKAHETVFLLSKSQDYFYDVDAIRGPNRRRLRTIWEIPTEPQKANGSAAGHPAVMPLTIAHRCLAITSREGSVVLDPYAGSGTTLVAARNLGRKWIGIDLNPAYVDLMARRLAST